MALIVIGSALARDGYCAFQLAYGQYHGMPAYGRIEDSGKELARFARRVLRAAKPPNWRSWGNPKVVSSPVTTSSTSAAAARFRRVWALRHQTTAAPRPRTGLHRTDRPAVS